MIFIPPMILIVLVFMAFAPFAFCPPETFSPEGAGGHLPSRLPPRPLGKMSFLSGRRPYRQAFHP